MIEIPIELALERPMKVPDSPYGQCSRCYYVCTDIPRARRCPVCGAQQQDYTKWPDPELQELWKEQADIWDQSKGELTVIIAAMYFEASVFHLIFWGTVWLDPQLNWIAANVEEAPDKQKRIWEYLDTIRSHQDTDEALKRLFGRDGKQMLRTVLADNDARDFWKNYLALAKARNQILHRGRRHTFTSKTGQAILCDPQYAKRLDWCLKWIPICWTVFSKLHNEYIHKPMWKNQGSALKPV